MPISDADQLYSPITKHNETLGITALVELSPCLVSYWDIFQHSATFQLDSFDDDDALVDELSELAHERECQERKGQKIINAIFWGY